MSHVLQNSNSRRHQPQSTSRPKDLIDNSHNKNYHFLLANQRAGESASTLAGPAQKPPERMQQMKTTRCRFFSDFYDSVSQRAYPDICQRYDCAKDLYFGRLRFDALLSESIVLTDAQVLDGQLFNAVEPNVLAQRLARSDRDPMLYPASVGILGSQKTTYRGSNRAGHTGLKLRERGWCAL